MLSTKKIGLPINIFINLHNQKKRPKKLKHRNTNPNNNKAEYVKSASTSKLNTRIKNQIQNIPL